MNIKPPIANRRALAGVATFAAAWVAHDVLLTPFSHAVSRTAGMRQPAPGELLLPNYLLTCGLRVLFWLIVAAMLRRLVGRANPFIGADARPSPRDGGRGFGVAAAVLIAVAATLVVTGSGSFDVPSRVPVDLLMRAAGWLGGEMLLATAEELAFRGILLWLLVPLVGTGGAIMGSALAFSTAHYGVGSGQPVFFVYVVVQGVILGQSVARTGDLGWAIGYHACWDWLLGDVLGMGVGGYRADTTVLAFAPHGPDWLTGGAAGPEGSLVTLLLLTGLVLRSFPGHTASPKIRSAGG